MKIIEDLQIGKDITSLSNFQTKALSKYYFEINTKDDIKMDLKLRNNDQLIPAARMKPGEYDLELRWNEKDKSYLIKKKIEWKLP